MATTRKFTDEFMREAVKLATQPGVIMTKIGLPAQRKGSPEGLPIPTLRNVPELITH